jgi:predicted alpha/beta-hydrolase family hydrolase
VKKKATKAPADAGDVIQLEVSGKPISASVQGKGDCAVILGPGAGGTRMTPQLLAVAAALDPKRYTTLLFNFPYQEAKRSFPDAAPVLENTFTALARHAREHLGARTVILGGRSMGGRMASMAVSSGAVVCDGLTFLAYPLHPPGQEEKIRDAHLAAIKVPMLFLQGTRDVFARLELLKGVVKKLGSRAELKLFEDADHSFKTPRGAALNSKQTEAAMIAELTDWLSRVGRD